MDSLPEALGKRHGIAVSPGADRHNDSRRARRINAAVIDPSGAPAPSVTGVPFAAGGVRRVTLRAPSPELIQKLKLPLKIYLASRVLYLAIIVTGSLWHGYSLTNEVTNWDGVWYDSLAHYGYPSYAAQSQTTLGFLPLYSILMLFLSHVSPLSNADAGLVISTVGGFVATVIIGQLAERWWDAAASRRVMLFFCLFPGSIVFSMVYSEGILLPLAAGALLALEYRRWFIAGLLGACATATAPVAVAIIPASAVAALRALYLSGHWDLDRPRAVVMPILRGLRDPQARRSLWAPALAPVGLGIFALYLWYWTGTPLASYNAQRYGWGEKSTIFAVSDDVGHMFTQLFAFGNANFPNNINLNYESGVIGALFLLCALWLMLRSGRHRGRMSAAAIVWTLWCAVANLTSANTPPNPRMLICAFPALMIVAAKLRRTGYGILIGVSTSLLIVMSFLTYYGYPAGPLRP